MEEDLSEEDLLAQAIALSLEGAALPPATAQVGEPQEANPQDLPEVQSSIPHELPTRTENADTTLGQKTERMEHGDSVSSILPEIVSQSGSGTLAPTATLPAVRLSDIQEWQPNRECLELIMGMGISANAARRALYHTGNDNAELAVAWVFENIESPELHERFEPPPITIAHPSQIGPVFQAFDDVAITSELEEDSYKMVFVVNTELKMGVGKIAAQVGHATLGLYRFIQGQANQREAVKEWERDGSKKIVLKGNSAHHLLELKRRAYELHIPNIIVHDAGRTQIEPGSLTIFALFGRASEVDQVTGNLKLL